MEEFIQQTQVLWQQIVSHPESSLWIIFILFIIESLLSVDNAAVLATMVADLPEHQKAKALKYGIWGAYIFRGLAMIFAGVLINFWWIKPLGGLYLLYLVYAQFNKSDDSEDPLLIKIFVNPIKYLLQWLFSPLNKLIFNPLLKWLDEKRKLLGLFWSTVILVEIMDMAFSIDNVLAAVAYTKNILLVCIGVFIGILAMRFIAQWFVKLMEQYGFLESAAYIVIGVLGVKLLLSSYTHFYPCSELSIFIEGSLECNKARNIPNPPIHEISNGDIITSILTLSIFFVPILTSILFNYPRKSVAEQE